MLRMAIIQNLPRFFFPKTPIPPVCRSNQNVCQLDNISIHRIFCAFAKLADMVSKRNDDKNLVGESVLCGFKRR